jgi:uncharacterized protein (TIGR02996 family)
MTDEREALLRTIIANPDEDTPRLVYADWLEERAGTVECDACNGVGQRDIRGYIEFSGGFDKVGRCGVCKGSGRVSNGFRERAEFIRVQCRIAEINREAMSEEDCEHPACEICKERRQLLLRESVILKGDSDSGGWIDWGQPAIPLLRLTQPYQEVIAFSRGFIDTVSCTLADWLANGKVICREHPVRPHAGMITDRQPYWYESINNYFWFDNWRQSGHRSLPHYIPNEIFAHLDWEFDYRAGESSLTSEESARLALSRAAIAWARS